MPERFRFAASLTVCGLIADLGYIAVEAAARFSLIHQWTEAAAFFAVGVAATAVAVSGVMREANR